MATPDKCPRCDCEGNKLACEMCYYFGFKCPGTCACCADRRDLTQKQARVGNYNNQRESTQRQVRVGNCNEQRANTQRQVRAPLRPLILRNCTKASVGNNQKKASSSILQTKVENSSVSVSSTTKVNSTVSESSISKVNLTGSKSSLKKVNLSKVKKSKRAKVNAGIQIPKHIVTFVAEPEIPQAVKEYMQKETEECRRRWNSLFWPQWDQVPCEPPQNVNQKTKPNITSRQKLEEATTEIIGDHCLNCHCKNPRDPCEICRRCDFQCLGTCRCCLPFRAGQRYMVFVTRGIFQLPDGSYYGGGSVNLSYTVPDNSENHSDKNPKAEKKSVWVRIMQAIQANIYLRNLTKAVAATAISGFFVVLVIFVNRNKTLLRGMLMRMRQTLLRLETFLDLKI